MRYEILYQLPVEIASTRVSSALTEKRERNGNKAPTTHTPVPQRVASVMTSIHFGGSERMTR